MAVVSLKDDGNDNDFNNLIVPVEVYSEEVFSCKIG